MTISGNRNPRKSGKTKFSGLSGVSGAGRRKSTPNLVSTVQEKENK